MTSEPSSTEKQAKNIDQADRPLSLWDKYRENIQIIAIALVLSVLLRMFVAEPRYIPSDSMIPTLSIGDRLVIEKVSYRWREPQAGDIVVFEPPPILQEQGFTKEQVFIKRIVATEGQTVAVKNGQLYLDGIAIKEEYIDNAPDYEWGPATVPPGQYFVMGDNRSNSRDSHVWGFLPKQNIIGRAAWRFWPLDKLSTI